MTAAPASPEPGEPPEPDVRPEPGDAIAAEEFLGGHELHGLRSIGGSLFHNTRITVGSDFNVGTDAKKTVLPTHDVTQRVADGQTAFAEPPDFGSLVNRLERKRVLLLTGAGWGAIRAAETALFRLGLKPILHVPAQTPRELVSSIEHACKKEPAAGFVIESIDDETLSGLAGFELRRLSGILGSTAALILTARDPGRHPAELATFACTPPDASAIVKQSGLPADVRERAARALEYLEPPVSPADATSLLEHAEDPSRSPEESAEAILWDPSMLDDWLSAGPDATAVASLAGAATLDGVPRAEVDAVIADLGELLNPHQKPSTRSVRFGSSERTLPAGIVEISRRSFSTHFGRSSAAVVQLCPPHRRDHVVAYLWRNLGGTFERSYLEWLKDLGGHDDARVREGAAITAGILFAIEPIVAESRILRPWALSDLPRQRGCVGLALGVPATIGDDPTPARSLARNWGNGPNLALRHAAVTAYGGLLGAWDSGAAAAARLWIVGEETPELRAAADASLAWLVAAGTDAGEARAAVLGVMIALLDIDRTPRRVYEFLPRAVARLVAGDGAARDSLDALFTEREAESLAALATLFARAFDAPAGHSSARVAFHLLLEAVSGGIVKTDVALELVREMKVAARKRSRLSAFGSQLERALLAEIRGRNPLRDAAQSIHSTFFVSN